MKKFLLFAAFTALTISAAPPTFRPQIKVTKVSGMNIKNAIDHLAWKNVPSYQLLNLVFNIRDINRKPTERGSVKYLYDDKYFYVRADFNDRDIMTNAKEDGGHMYLQGDLLEVFIKPDGANYYWEIYGTPNNLQTRFHFGAKATVGLPSGFTHQEVGIKVITKISGTLNNPDDIDQGYIVLVAIPIDELNSPHFKDKAQHPAGTVPFAPGVTWRVQSARYNYGRHLADIEFSCYPQAYGGYHATEYYAEMEIVK